MGITRKNFWATFKSVLPFTVLSSIALLLVTIINPEIMFVKETEAVNQNGLLPSILLYSLLMAPLQELLFRGFLIARLKLVTKNGFALLFLSSIVFMLAHAPFANMYFVLGTFIPGLIWGYIYLTKRNLFAIAFSHVVVGLMVFLPTIYLLQDKLLVVKSSPMTVSELVYSIPEKVHEVNPIDELNLALPDSFPDREYIEETLLF